MARGVTVALLEFEALVRPTKVTADIAGLVYSNDLKCCSALLIWLSACAYRLAFVLVLPLWERQRKKPRECEA